MARERVSFTFDPGDMLLSLQIDFSVVGAVVACAILEGIPAFELLSETTAPRYLKLETVSSFFHHNFPLNASGAFDISLVLSALISILTLHRLCQDFQLGLLVHALP